MKTIILVLIVGAIYCQAQTQRVVQVPFTYNGSQNNYINAIDTKWQINQFQFGWHWGGHKSINKALGFNQSHSKMNSANDFTNNTNLTYVDKGILGGDSRVGAYTNAIAIEWEAALKINEQKLGLVQDIKDANNILILDREKPVFGFMNQLGTVASEQIGNETNAVLKLNTNLVSDPQNPPIVLSNNWPNKNIRKNQEIKSDDPFLDKDEQRQFFGFEFYVSIHIRRDDLNDIIKNSDAVLEIQLPYTINNVTDYIIFDSLPFDNQLEFEFHNNRGRRQKTFIPAPKDNVLRITKNMLPLNNEYITINAFFRCKDYININLPNYSLIEPELNIEVKYLGNCNIALDWIRIESPIAHKLFWVDYDAEITTEVQNVINQYEDNSFVSKDVFLKRIYLRDENNFEYWKATKYFNELVGNIGTYASGALMPRLFESYVNPPEFWVEMYSKQGWITQPYTRYGYFGLNRGFLYPPITQIDSLKSHYETYLTNNQSFLTTLLNLFKGDVTRNIHDWGASKSGSG